MMKVGDLVLHRSATNGAYAAHLQKTPGIVLKVYDYRFDHLTEEGSKIRAMASVQWFQNPGPMEHRQDRLEVISENR